VGTHGSVNRWTGDIFGDPFFLGAVRSVQLCGVSVKGCHIRGLPAGSVRRTYVDWRGKHTCRVDRFSPTGCTSIRIAVTLGYE
jgi:hypothetical protein